VIVLHGGAGNSLNAEQTTGMSEKADEEGFIVVYPDGTGILPNILLTGITTARLSSIQSQTANTPGQEGGRAGLVLMCQLRKSPLQILCGSFSAGNTDSNIGLPHK